MFEDLARQIAKRNAAAREANAQLTGRMSAAMMSENWTFFDDFIAERSRPTEEAPGPRGQDEASSSAASDELAQ